jgi:hypothetical protein
VTNVAKETISAVKQFAIPELVDTHRAAEILGRSANTLKSRRAEGVGPDYVEIAGPSP